MSQFPIKTLIDPQAQVINRHSNTRSIKLIHRCLLSHLAALSKSKGSRMMVVIDGEPFDTEYNSTAQLAEDIGAYLNNRADA
ncbi:MAG: hypothetical protein WC865_13695 [Bacteroidales bacterium]